MLGANDVLKNGLHISIDWLSFTIKRNMSHLDVLSCFGLDVSDFRTGLNGANGYKSRLRHSIYPISVLYDGNDNMGIHVDVSGSAIGYFLESYRTNKTNCPTPFGSVAYPVESFDFTVLSDLLKDVMDMGHLTRLDIAIDDYTSDYYTMDELTDIFNHGLYVSRFKKWKLICEKDKDVTTGHSIYLGSRSSSIMFRIYDKKLEQTFKNKNDSVPDLWVRWEIELHRERASAVALLLISGESLGSLAIGIFSHYLRLIKRDNERDSRCSNSEKWDSFLCGIKKVRLCQPIPEKTLDTKREWVKKQVAPTLSAITLADGDIGFFYDLLMDGSNRFSAELLHILQDMGFTYDDIISAFK